MYRSYRRTVDDYYRYCILLRVTYTCRMVLRHKRLLPVDGPHFMSEAEFSCLSDPSYVP